MQTPSCRQSLHYPTAIFGKKIEYHKILANEFVQKKKKWEEDDEKTRSERRKDGKWKKKKREEDDEKAESAMPLQPFDNAKELQWQSHSAFIVR